MIGAITEAKEYCRYVAQGGIEISERGVFKQCGDDYVGVAFDPETRAAFIEFFGMLYWA